MLNSSELQVNWKRTFTHYFYVLFTMHPNMIVFFYQLDAQILYFNTFIIFLYMFRAPLCSSSGGQLFSTASGIATLETSE